MFSQQQEAALRSGGARTADAIARTEEALSYFLKLGQKFDQKDVRRRAGISSHFLHNHVDIREKINAAVAQSGGGIPGRKSAKAV